MTTYNSIYSLLKIGDQQGLPSINGAPEGLHVIQEHEPVVLEHVQDAAAPAILKNSSVKSPGLISRSAKHVKGLLIYPIIFIGAFAFFYTVLNFSSLTAQVQGYFAKPQDAQILGDDLTAYNQWMNGYYYAVTDRKMLDPNNDIDKDGLSNMDEFIMRTIPTIADSDGDGYSDGTEVINNYNPWGAGLMTASQKELAAKLDIIVLNNRISANTAEAKAGLAAGVNTADYDLNKPGKLSIPKLNMSVDLIWSKDPSDFEKDLTRGVIHYPGTALPGEVGTIYVSGHSSDYIWKKDPMRTIFAKINFLKPGDDIFIDVYGVDGKVHNYRYQVTGNKIYKPDDQAQFANESISKLNISTCWPIGTSTNRIVVSAVQVGL